MSISVLLLKPECPLRASSTISLTPHAETITEQVRACTLSWPYHGAGIIRAAVRCGWVVVGVLCVGQLCAGALKTSTDIGVR